ncbi:TPA: LOW QUALITY PROTEIN: hypothetical protein N0F65_005930 [Lagenidium giganteum]|uniref:PWI domain-containing protein n=1 Tax=Lagenidium giganteum TaxID=4803 RepID=A0AAV2Z7E6_9STRA|nr:TPA: LOW QUALITY PROTEIN: hypothetical protein N0F65_005930 [Lagenidium giganteum]
MANPRYYNQNKKLLAKFTFPECFNEKVDLSKVKREVIDQWITERITALLGFEDDIVVSTAINLLVHKVDDPVDPRQMQVALMGFLEKDAAVFMKELWELLLSAQAHSTGIPTQILEKKKQELEQIAAEKDKLKSVLDRKRTEATDHGNRRSPPRRPQQSSFQRQGGDRGSLQRYGRAASPPPRDRSRRPRSRSASRGRGRGRSPRSRSRPRSRRRSPSRSPPPRSSPFQVDISLRVARPLSVSSTQRTKLETSIKKSPSPPQSFSEFGVIVQVEVENPRTAVGHLKTKLHWHRPCSHCNRATMSKAAARARGQIVDPTIASGSDAELESFLAQEAEAANPKKRKPAAVPDGPKLFMQLSRSEQKRIGANAPVLRQVEGDSISHRVRIYRRTVFFHIHSKLNHNAYVMQQLRVDNQDPNGKDLRLTDAEIHVRIRQEKGRTALHYACRYESSSLYCCGVDGLLKGSETTARTLVYEEATIDDPDLEMRWTPLHYAVMGGHEDCVRLLIDKAPVRRITINRRDVRVHLLGSDHYDFFSLLLLQIRDNATDGGKRDSNACALISFGQIVGDMASLELQACGEDHADVARVLLKKKAFIDDTDDDGWSALHYAAVNDAALAAEVLVEYDANLKQRTYSTNETALEMAERLRCHLVAILLYEVMYRKH